LADASAAIRADPYLGPRTKSQWLTALVRIPAFLDRPPEVIPARIGAIRQEVAKLVAARCGVSEGSLATYKSALRAALVWYAKEADVPRRGTPLDKEWSTLCSAISSLRDRANLYPMMRYCSGRQIPSRSVNDQVFAVFIEYRRATTFLDCSPQQIRKIARSWNRCAATVPGWPAVRLTEPAMLVRLQGPACEEFLAGFLADVESYIDGLTQLRRSTDGKRRRPCKPSTLVYRRRLLMATARKAVAIGIPLHRIDSLPALLEPDIAEQVIDAYWRADGETPGSYTIDLGRMLVLIAHQIGVDGDKIDRLRDIYFRLSEYQTRSLTEKNLAVIRQVLTTSVWSAVVRLPFQLMQEADAVAERSPVKAAVLAELAVAIRILTMVPVRIANLASIEIERNLIRPGGHGDPYWLVFPDYEVKNRQPLERPLDHKSSELIKHFIHRYRPTLLRRQAHRWLFPGMHGGHKNPRTLAEQITKTIAKRVGLTITPHQFRHAAAAIILKHHRGNYELVRLILGHKSVQTTIRFYVGLDSMFATEQFGELVLKHVGELLDADEETR